MEHKIVSYTNKKPHAICLPAPTQSHINFMLQFAKLLYYKGFHITFVNTEFNHKRILKSRGPDALAGLPDFQFEDISDGLPPSDPDATQSVKEIIEVSRTLMLGPFNELVDKLKGSSDVPPVSCIVGDGFLPFVNIAAEQNEIPLALLYPISASCFMVLEQFPTFRDKGLTPLEDESCLTNDFLDQVVEVPGMKDVHFRDLPFFVRTTDPNNALFNFVLESVWQAQKAIATVIITFEALEQQVLDAISSMHGENFVYAIGPLPLLLDQMKQPHHDDLSSIGCNLWKEENECLRWLDSKEPNSVLYVNFGSIAVLTKEQLIEFAMGLAKSGHPFLWIIRPDLVVGESAILPPQFIEETGDKCYITSWCPQKEVLKHPSVRGFLTHCGWGSTLESISSGVPMLCWPFASEQNTNCRSICHEWGIGIEVDHDVKRDGLRKLVMEFMEGEESENLKRKALEWKKLAEEANYPNGSSYINLDKFVKDVLLSRNH